jgi:hypothetical protein
MWARWRERLYVHREALFSVSFFLLLVWAGYNWSETVARVVRYHNDLPVWDYWRVPYNLRAYQSFALSVLWQQHNEHRIVFPEIAFAIDILALHGRQILPVALSFFCYFLNWTVLGFVFWAETSVSQVIRAFAILLAGIIIGWQGSAVLISSPFLLQWTLMQLAVLGALAFLGNCGAGTTLRHLVGSIACGVVANYSSGNGMLIWPVLILAAVVLSIPKRKLLALVGAAFLSTSAYFHGYRPTNNLQLGNFFHHPLYAVGFTATYIAMPFSAIKSTAFGVAVGVISMVCCLLFLVIAWRVRSLQTRTGVVLFGWYLFALATAILTAAGRMTPADPSFASARPGRYITVPLVTWAVVILIALWTAECLKRKAASLSLVVVFSLFLLLGLPKLRWWLQRADTDAAAEQLAALGIEDGINDPNVIAHIFPSAPFVNALLPELKRHGLSIFREPHQKWLGRSVFQFAPLVRDSAPGETTYTFPVASGVEVAGWVDDSRFRGSTGWIVFADGGGRILGFGKRFAHGLPTGIPDERIPSTFAWAGFAKVPEVTHSFVAYLLNRRGLMPIPGSIIVPPVHLATEGEAGPAIDVQWVRDAIWTSGALPAHPAFTTIPSGRIYESWAGSDANTGTMMSSSFERPQNGCVIVPVLQGPVSAGLSVELRDAETQSVLAELPFQDGLQQWSFWKVCVPESAKHVQIIARDQGRDRGEWLALAPPDQCR